MKTKPMRHYVASAKKSAATARRMKEARAKLLHMKALVGTSEQSQIASCASLVSAVEENSSEGQADAAQGG